jgi:hypothetical protein
MLNENLNNSSNKKIELALCALMFFSPLIKNQIKKIWDLKNDDITFINWFIKLGYLNIIILMLIIISNILYYRTDINLFLTIWTCLIILLIIMLITWSIFAITEKPISHNNTSIENKTYKFESVLDFIPIYNIYTWYNKHDFTWNENIWIKESLLLWWIFSIVLCFNAPTIILIIPITIILLVIWINITNLSLWEKYISFINNLFSKNPEETRWKIIWILISPFNKKTLDENTSWQQMQYSLIYKIEHKQILLELILLIVISIVLLILGIAHKKYQLICGISLILSRYILMAVKRKHMTHIPIIKEFTSIFFKSNKNNNEQSN